MESEQFRFNGDWKTALDVGDTFVLTGMTVLPREGGILDQDYFEWQDLLTYLRGYTWAKHINNPKGDNSNDPFNFQQDGAATDIADFVN